MNSSQSSSKPAAGTRRDFLKTSATATAAAATLGALDLARFAHAQGSDIIKVGMIGCGGRNSGAGNEALHADKGARLVAMCDIFADRVKNARAAIGKQCPGQVEVKDDDCFTGFDSYKKVIELSDVVLIANAAKFHPLHALAAIQAGKHVFVEKPHGIDPAGIKMLKQAVEVAKEKKLSVMSGLHSRHHPGYIETIQRIHDGAIGEIIAIEENFLRAPYGILERNPQLDELRWQCSTQYHFNWLSGDDVVQSLVHNMDRATWVLREAAPIKCHGLGGRSTMTAPIYGNVFDHHSVIYEFPNGVRVYAFCRTTNGCYDEDSSLIFGSKGKASVKNARIWGETNWRSEAKGNPYQIEHDKLFAAIRSGNPVNCGDYMARSTQIGIMGQISCYTGKEVTWEQMEKSDFFYPPKSTDCHDDMAPPVVPGPDGSYPTYKPGLTKLI
jgi:myo-inositol 2-dehydrogenase / D-chiro-inositol 1-dehydrogenase